MNDPLQTGLHPNADTLSAFAENALPAHERMQTLAHLADCAPCREIVFLAQQAAPQPEAAPAPFWQLWRNSAPLFGLGIGAAALACAGLLFMTLRTHTTTSPTESARILPDWPLVRDPIASPHTGPKAPALPLAAPSKLPQIKPEPAKAMPKIEAAPQPLMAGRAFAGSSSGSAAGMGTGVGAPHPAAIALGNGAPATAESTTAPMPAAPPSAYETVEVQSAGQALSTETPRGNTAMADEARVSNTLAEQKMSQMARQRDAAPAAAPASQIAMLAAPAVRAPLPSKLAISTTVSSGARTLAADTAGALFLSLDAGRHWQPVTPHWTGKVAQLRLAPAKSTPVAPPAALSLDGLATDDSKPTAAPAAKLPAAPPEFQLITAAGAVWTSTDGQHWQPR